MCFAEDLVEPYLTAGPVNAIVDMIAIHKSSTNLVICSVQMNLNLHDILNSHFDLPSTWYKGTFN